MSERRREFDPKRPWWAAERTRGTIKDVCGLLLMVAIVIVAVVLLTPASPIELAPFCPDCGLIPTATR